MATTTVGAFSDFLRRIEPTAAQWDVVKGRKETAASLLVRHFTGSDLPLSRTAMIGSAAKRTIIRPVDDVDMMAVFDNLDGVYERYRSDSKPFLYRVRDVFSGAARVTVGARGQAVRLFYQRGGHVDIAPVFANAAGGFLLPSGNGGWVTTDPERCTEWLDGRDRALGGRLRPLVRLLKAWNRAHSSRLRSFHLETLAASMFTSLGTHQAGNLKVFFANLDQARLHVVDPAGYSGHLDGYLTPTARFEIATRATVQEGRAASALRAEEDGDHREAIRLWGIVLGPEFPAYG